MQEYTFDHKCLQKVFKGFQRELFTKSSLWPPEANASKALKGMGKTRVFPIFFNSCFAGIEKSEENNFGIIATTKSCINMFQHLHS